MRNNKVSILSLGCSKNLVDSERLCAMLRHAGLEACFVDDIPAEGSALVVNTCGFIGDAKEESVNTLLQACQAKKKRKLRAVVAMGCLSERYRSELDELIPELDAVYGKFDWPGICEFFGNTKAEQQAGRVLASAKHNAYIKISEGCNRHCAFCAIPLITGAHHSRTAADILAEVSALAANGTKEFNIIAQDLSSYGRDLQEASDEPLADLLENMASIAGVEMIRLHYAYPADFPYGILPVMARHANICKYLDIALQHIDDGVLEAMHRHINGEQTRALLQRIRTEVPGIHIRTTIMVGFPGEDDAAFESLLAFVRQQRFERLGAFAYCEEDGTFAQRHYKDNIPQKVKDQRLERLMEVQQEIAWEINDAKVGQTLRTIIDRYDDNEGMYIGRTEFDSPDVDGEVLIPAAKGSLEVGYIYNVKITASEGFDLRGMVVEAQ